jgi:flagellar motor protein MotB
VAKDFLWDGRDDSGNIAPDGTYEYEVRSTDKAGNHTAVSVPGIVIDTRLTPVYIAALSKGFSPNGDGFMDTMKFSVFIVLNEDIATWSVSMVHSVAGTEATISGKGALPTSLSWDGMIGGKSAPEGAYTAILRVAYAKGNTPTAQSFPFKLDVTPPVATITPAPDPFSPDNDGVDDELAIKLAVSDLSDIDRWDAVILDPAGHPFYKISGKGMPADRIMWNGLSDSGELVQAAEEYPFVLTVRDEFGNTGTSRVPLHVDVLVIREGDNLKVRISSITFVAETADYLGGTPDVAEKNRQIIKRLAEILKKFPGYRIRIEGHAVMVNWEHPDLVADEQENELIPLSKARAEAIKTALVKEGLNPARITTVGIGGSQPIVPFSDLENRWKDRRVEFILMRE